MPERQQLSGVVLLSLPPDVTSCFLHKLFEFPSAGLQVLIYRLAQQPSHGSPALPLEVVQALNLVAPQCWLIHRLTLLYAAAVIVLATGCLRIASHFVQLSFHAVSGQ